LHKTALGYAEASALGIGTFSGQVVDSTSVLIAYTYAGDANLDRTVDTIDFNLLAANFSGSGKIWGQADFNYDGSVDTIDFNLLASNFSLSLPSATTSLAAVVPEPAAVAITMMIFSAAGARRRRNA
jgi:hypothetical protein